MRERLYIVVPAYNEAENIGRLIDEWYPIVEKHNGGGTSRLVIINDGSRDNTYDIVCSYAKDHCFSHCPNRMEDMVQQSCMVTGMQFKMRQIIFFRQIQMDRPIHLNSMHFGRCVKNMMLLSGAEVPDMMEYPESLWRKFYWCY